jgi:RNA polymerase sigma factor (sigma-70 family)
MRRETRQEYEWLFRAAYPRIRRTVTMILRDHELAEDVTQEAFLKLLRHWRIVSGYDQPEAWVRRVAIRLAVRHAQREIGRRERERVTSASEARSDPEPDVDLADAIAVLAPMQRAAVVLYYYADLPIAEIARNLVVSESTVKQHLHRARGRLAELLAEEVEHRVD